MKVTGPSNENVKSLILSLKKQSHLQNVNLWKKIAAELETPARNRRVINLSRLSRFTREKETVIVPGKVLGAGTMDHSIIIAAMAFSGNAKQQIENAKGKCMTIEELAKQNPKGKGVRVIG